VSTEVRGAAVVIAAAARTPFGRFGGVMRGLSIPELGSLATAEALRRAGVSGDEVDELALGVNFPGSDRSIARQTALRAGIPDDRNAYTVDRACCSSLTAIGMATRSVRLGEASIASAGGAENMSRVPYFIEDLRWGHPLGNITLADQLMITCPHTHVARAIQAADEALRFGVSREEQDRWALRSQDAYEAARRANRLDDEMFPVELPASSSGLARLDRDESPRPDTTIEKLAALPTVYESATVTAGNAPGMGTGASSVVLMTAETARRRGLTPLATIVASAMSSGEPQKIASIPAVAAWAVLKKAGMDGIGGVDLVEINEAFAAVPLVTTLVLADGERSGAEGLRERVNVNGGAIALGHPTGATGARMVMTLAYELRRRGGGVGLVTLCGGVGEGEAVLIRVDDRN
jgi:acetyl-CoA C-acetyltransferase